MDDKRVPSRDLDKLISQLIFNGQYEGPYLPYYSDYITAAWDIVEMLVSQGRVVSVDCLAPGRYQCVIDEWYNGEENTPALAICSAALDYYHIHITG